MIEDAKRNYFIKAGNTLANHATSNKTLLINQHCSKQGQGSYHISTAREWDLCSRFYRNGAIIQ